MANAHEVKTMILRFRDLVTSPGETIKIHKDICDTKNFVWWGWWKKAGETIPNNAFKMLKKKANSPEKLVLYLLDSGQKKIFEAECTDLKWEPSHDPFGTPDIENTPEYYKKQEYLAWFKFTNISQTHSEKPISNSSYVCVNELFEDGCSKYKDFYNKKICSIEELTQQDRTIWFIRDFKKGDLSHEIKLLDHHKIKPADFPEEYFQTSSRHLLWLSDLHFSNSNECYGFPITSSDEVKERLEQRIEHALKENNIKNIGGAIISGDITWKAAKEEFNLAHSFILNLFSWSKLNSYQLAMCPGNHDIAFSDNPSDGDSKIIRAFPDAREEFETFYEQLFYVKPNEFISSGRRFLLGNAIPVEIVCLNSSFLEQKRNEFQGHGFLGKQQLDNAARQMGWENNPDPIAFRIVVLHHHLLPVTFREEPVFNYQYSVVLDAEAFSQWLIKHGVRLVLHGHKHDPFLIKISKPRITNHQVKGWGDYHVLGMGSSGASQKHLGDIGFNTIGVLEFKKNKIEISLIKIHPVNDSFKEWSVEIPYNEHRDFK
ncbi:MAG: metallophosphoesterase family protein [Candidatus Omnitrophota bacterium]